MALHVFDGNRFWRAATMAEAEEIAETAIDAYRDMCDPEWPDSVEQVAIYEAPVGSEDPDEDGRCISIATQIDERPDPSGQCDYWCDYAMAAPANTQR